MLRILWNSRAGMNAQQDKMDCISNNLSNVNTSGYKKEDVSFSDLVSESLNRQGYPIAKNTQRTVAPYTGTGVKTTEWIRDFSQGNLNETGMKTDLAIDGAGLFRVTLPSGEKAYIRSSNFNIDGNGKLVDNNGDRLDITYYKPENQVVLNHDNFTVGEDGTITVTNGNEKGTVVGKINLYNAVGDNSFVSIGNNLYKPNTGVTVYQVATKDASILQGVNELSNVDLSEEMTDLIVTQRAFELNSKGLKTADDMWSMVNNLRGK